MPSSFSKSLLLFIILCFNGTLTADSSDPIQTAFNLPSPLPQWPPGGRFASGSIDLGGLQVREATTFKKIWATNDGGPENLGSSFYDPDPVPNGFFSLGSYTQPNNIPLFGHVLVAKDVSNCPSNPSLKPPINYTLVWSSESLDVKKDGDGYVWLPVPPDGYRAVGYLVSNSSVKPSPDKIRCVRVDFTDANDTLTTNQVGAFVGNYNLSSLKNVKGDTMPNLDQIHAIIHAYSPVIYFHPDETYLPSSVEWFFQNGGLVYRKGEESKPNPIDQTGSNLPQGGSNDDTYWLDLPLDGSAKDKVKKGDLQSANAYFHVKPVSGGLFTDIAIWVFYPFNGGSRAKVEFVNLSLGKLGEHVGDWEHVTLRVSNLNGELKSVFFSQHGWGEWVSASTLEYATGNKPVVYSSLHGHASYPKPGCVLIGSRGGEVGVRDDTGKGGRVMDTGVGAMVVAAEYLGAAEVVEPPWLNYERKWGPKIDYDFDKEIGKVKRLMIGKLKRAFERFVESVPREMLGEDGPTGPKVKSSWTGNEIE